MTSKTSAREYAFKFLYSLFLDKAAASKQDVLALGVEKALLEFDPTYFEPDQEHPSESLPLELKKFAIELIQGTLKHEAELLTDLDAHLHNWKSHQLDKVDLTVLLLASFELKYEKSTPPKVVMNEAINLSKAYGSNDSSSFINGILDKIAKTYGHQHLR
jgi:transcription antitermination protein NusB